MSSCDTDIADPVLRHTPEVETHSDTFATSASCRACHPDAYDTWQATYHRTMTQRAGPESVLGDWDDVRLERDGRAYHLYREGDAFWVDMPRPGTRGTRGARRPVIRSRGLVPGDR